MKKLNKIPGMPLKGYLFILVMIFFLSCKKFIEVDAPVTSVNGKNVYTEDVNAIAAITSIYAKMSNSDFSTNLSILPELSADNLDVVSSLNTNYTAYYKNALTPSYTDITSFWGSLYNYVYLTNAAIIGLNASTTLTPSIKQHLLGEVYFLRAFYYFYLVNLYGDIPMALTTDYNVNTKMPRTSIKEVYQQIISDLDKAKVMLDEKYLGNDLLTQTSERVRPNRMTVYALLARVQLFNKNFSAAEAAASEVIGKTELYSASIGLDQVFIKNSKETIWAIQPVKLNLNTDEAQIFLNSDISFRPVHLSSDLISVLESADNRGKVWIESVGNNSYPAKYKILFGNASVKEYAIVFRLSEQYLIRSEARAKQDNITGAKSDLDVIRHRAGLGDTPASTQQTLLTAILKERRLELFSEWGHRWFDLKRTEAINAVMNSYADIKGITWAAYKSLYPLPQSEIRYNNNLVQNPNYSN